MESQTEAKSEAKSDPPVVSKQELDEMIPEEINGGIITATNIEIKKEPREEETNTTEVNQSTMDFENFIGNNDPINIKSEDVNTIIDTDEKETYQHMMIGAGISLEDEVEKKPQLNLKGEVIDMEPGDVKDEPAEESSESSSSEEDSSEESQKDKENYLGYVETGDHEKFECNTCDYQCQKRSRMKLHMLVHKGPSETTMYPCSVCSFQTKYKWYLDQHVKIVHGPDADAPKKYPCTKCSFRTNSRHTLRVHQLTHLDIADKFKCEHCDFESKFKHLVDRHLCSKKPLERSSYRCSLCSYTSKLKTGVYNHMTVHKKPSETTMYECELCQYKSKWPHCLRNHLKTHKKQEIPVHKCEHCDFQANNKYSVKTHAQKHEGPRMKKIHQCHVCAYQCPSRQKLGRHMETHKAMSERQQFACAQCDFKTLVKLNLKRHVLLNHVDLKQFEPGKLD